MAATFDKRSKQAKFDETQLVRLRRIDMYKAYVYHNSEEKEALEKELLAKTPPKKRKALSKALMDFF